MEQEPWDPQDLMILQAEWAWEKGRWTKGTNMWGRKKRLCFEVWPALATISLGDLRLITFIQSLSLCICKIEQHLLPYRAGLGFEGGHRSPVLPEDASLLASAHPDQVAGVPVPSS